MKYLSLLLAAALCVGSASATDYTGTMTLVTSSENLSNQNTVMTVTQNYNGTYNAATNLSFTFQGSAFDLGQVSFEYMEGTVDSDGYTHVSATKNIKLSDFPAVTSLIPATYQALLGTLLDRPIPVEFAAAFNNAKISATAHLQVTLTVTIPYVGTQLDIINTPVDVTFTGTNENAVEYNTGDVDGNGMVDIDDVNILINILLGNDSAANYDGRASVVGNDTSDIEDVNATINIMLAN